MMSHDARAGVQQVSLQLRHSEQILRVLEQLRPGIALQDRITAHGRPLLVPFFGGGGKGKPGPKKNKKICTSLREGSA